MNIQSGGLQGDQSVNESKATSQRAETGTRVAFELTPAMLDEVDRMVAITDLGSRPEVFRRAFTLLRIHVDAAIRGREIYMVHPDRPSEKYLITLPFIVRRESELAER